MPIINRPSDYAQYQAQGQQYKQEALRFLTARGVDTNRESISSRQTFSLPQRQHPRRSRKRLLHQIRVRGGNKRLVGRQVARKGVAAGAV